MSDITLTNGLLNIGGILTETYTRDTRATTEAKQELGLDPNKAYKSSIGIANVEEFVTMSMTNLQKGQTAIFNLAQFEQALILKSLYIDNANQDQVVIEVWAKISSDDDGDGYAQLLTQSFNRNKTPVQFPDAPLPPNIRLRVTAKTDINYMQLAFKPCVIIASGAGILQQDSFEEEDSSNGNTRR